MAAPVIGPAGEELVLVGRTQRPHGLRGELRLHSYAVAPELFSRLPRLWLRVGEGPCTPFVPRSWRRHHEFLLLSLTGIADRTQAEAWGGAEVYAAAADLPPAEEGEVYVHQLLGSRVVLADGRELGWLDHLVDAPQEVWSIRTADGREILFPAHPDFIVAIDLEARAITVAPPEGLVDIYLQDTSGRTGH